MNVLLSTEQWIVLATVTLLLMFISALTTYWRQQRINRSLIQENAQLLAELDAHKLMHSHQQQSDEKSQQMILNAFNSLAGKALAQNNLSFLQLAEENLKQHQVTAKSELDKKEQAIETLVKPIRDILEKTEQQLQSMEKERRESYGALHKHLETMAQNQQLLQGETRNLVNALRRPEVRGQWGEMTLKRLAELAGMVEHCDFFQQQTVNTEGGKLRPDMIVRLPAKRDIVVDIKTPLDAYLKAVEATTEADKQAHLVHHARQVRQRIKELSSKAYWQQFENAPDFVVLFIPGDQFLSAALEIDYSLLEDAMQAKVILSTPTSFVALLRAVAYGWRQESLSENAEQIRNLGEELYSRISYFSEHLAKTGKSLEQSVSHYNKAVASFENRIAPSVRKFSEYGINSKKTLNECTQIDTAPREVSTEKDGMRP